jgi:hypothetical protein
MVNEMEVQGNAVERIEDYLIIDQEPVSVPSKEPPAAWPTSPEDQRREGDRLAESETGGRGIQSRSIDQECSEDGGKSESMGHNPDRHARRFVCRRPRCIPGLWSATGCLYLRFRSSSRAP